MLCGVDQLFTSQLRRRLRGSRLEVLTQATPEAFAFRHTPYEFETELPAFDLITGSSAARTALEAGASPEDVVSLVAPVDPSLAEAVLAGEARVLRAVA
jgi:hypothetical protein